MSAKTLWISNTGRVACSEHGGMYLESAIQQHPRARQHVTPLDVWTRATAADVAAWPADLGVLSCETCGAEALTTAKRVTAAATPQREQVTAAAHTCGACDYTGTSSRAVKVHAARAHKPSAPAAAPFEHGQSVRLARSTYRWTVITATATEVRVLRSRRDSTSQTRTVPVEDVRAA